MTADFEIGWDNVPNAGVGSPADRLAKTSEEREVAVATDRQNAIALAVDEAVEAARPGLNKIPDPVEPAGDGALTDDEEERLDKCIGGVQLLSTAYWVAGKSLDTMATGRLFRDTPHKLESERFYETIEEWAAVEYGIKVQRLAKLRNAWELGEVLQARGYKAPEGQVRELVPMKKAMGLNAAVGLYIFVAETVGASKVTADRLREAVSLLPGDLTLPADDPAVIAAHIGNVLTLPKSETEAASAVASSALPAALKREVDSRAIKLADRLNQGRIPRNVVMVHLLEAFADEQDPRVFEAVFDRMKRAPK